jgi:hypothetical protein
VCGVGRLDEVQGSQTEENQSYSLGSVVVLLYMWRHRGETVTIQSLVEGPGVGGVCGVGGNWLAGVVKYCLCDCYYYYCFVCCYCYYCSWCFYLCCLCCYCVSV